MNKIDDIHKGDKKTYTVTFTKNNVAENISTWTVSLYLYTDPASTSVYSDINEPGDHSDPTNGKTILTIDATSLTAGVYYYEIIANDGTQISTMEFDTNKFNINE